MPSTSESTHVIKSPISHKATPTTHKATPTTPHRVSSEQGTLTPGIQRKTIPNNPNTLDEFFQLYKAILGAGVEIIHTMGNVALNEYFSLMNVFLSGVKDEFERIVPSGNDVLSSAKMNESLLLAIEKIANSPEFKKKMETVFYCSC